MVGGRSRILLRRSGARTSKSQWSESWSAMDLVGGASGCQYFLCVCARRGDWPVKVEHDELFLGHYG